MNRRLEESPLEPAPPLAMPTSGHTGVSSKMIGIQVGAVSFVDEGTDKVTPARRDK
jgi:hypothetical protein